MLTPLQKRLRSAKRALAAYGLVEAVTWSFVSAARAEVLAEATPSLTLANPISPELSDMRPSLLPGLIAAAQRNADRGHGDVALFEVGQIFLAPTRKTRNRGRRDPAGLAKEKAPDAIGRCRRRGRLFDAKADLSIFFRRLAFRAAGFSLFPAGHHGFILGRSAPCNWGQKRHWRVWRNSSARLGGAWRRGPARRLRDLLNDIPATKSRSTKAKSKLELSEFMPVQRDFAFLVDRSIIAAISSRPLCGGRTLVTDAEVFDVYEGHGIAEGKKSIAISVTLQPRERTLTEAEIDAVAGKIVEAAKKTGATLRG